jgi:hypothetical protein
MYITYMPKAKKKMAGRIAWRHRTGQVLDPGSGTRGMFLPQTLHNETGRH